MHLHLILAQVSNKIARHETLEVILDRRVDMLAGKETCARRLVRVHTSMESTVKQPAQGGSITSPCPYGHRAHILCDRTGEENGERNAHTHTHRERERNKEREREREAELPNASQPFATIDWLHGAAGIEAAMWLQCGCNAPSSSGSP